MKNALTPKSTLVADVAQELRQTILSGENQPGQFLPSQKDLAVRFGVAPSTIHEAIQVLSSIGLVQSRPGKGTWVRSDALESLIHPAEVTSRFGNLDLRMVAEARSVIETALTEFAAQRATPADIEHIWNAVRAMEEVVNDEAAFVAADVDFHLAVARAGGNDLLQQLYHLSRRLLTEAVSQLVHSREVREESIVMQREIARMIAEHDVRGARETVHAHMGYVASLVNALDSSKSQ